jgi:hypothetical protein
VSRVWKEGEEDDDCERKAKEDGERIKRPKHANGRVRSEDIWEEE